MTNRERIILIFMAIAVVWGGYTFLYTSPTKSRVPDPVKRPEDLNQFVIAMASKITNKGTLDSEDYVVSKASAEWTQNPFREPGVPVKITKDSDLKTGPVEDSTRKTEFFYSGYLKMGDRSLAIINGKEYEIDERLDPAGCFVRDIFPTWVEIGIKGKTDTIIIPLQEFEAPSVEENLTSKAGYEP
jgi:hypothetical protein